VDRLNQYCNFIKNILKEYVEWDKRSSSQGAESLLIADDESGHYLLMDLGWPGGRRLLSIRAYVRLCDGKFWIEEDLTEEGIANELVRAGVPKNDIVLAFQAPEMRSYTEFAAA
jgi:XisI protein